MPLKPRIHKTNNAAADIVQKTCSNGVTLIAEPIEAVRTAAIGFWFSCGSRYEKAGHRGVSHFAEHMLFKGTKSRSAFDIAAAFDRMGGYANAFTEREQVCLYCVVPAVYARNALDILCDMTENSVFPDSELERERSVIESEIIASSDDPEEAALDAVAEILWPDNPLSLPIAGTVEDVQSLSADFLRSWYAEFFQQGELTVCISGNIDIFEMQNRLEKMKNRNLSLQAGRHTEKNCHGKKSGAKKPGCTFECSSFCVKTENTDKDKAGRVHFITADFRQEQFFMLYPLSFPFSLKDYYCWAVLNALIGDTMSSRLFQALREKSGYCYTVYSFFSMYADCGYWCAYACAPKKNAADIISTVRAELALLVKNGFSADEVQAAKEHVCGEEIINAEDTEYRMKRLARCRFFGFPQTAFDDSLQAVRDLSAQALSESLHRLLNPQYEKLVVYGPKLSAAVRKKK
ncbi:insulinase family protein [Treponema sp. OMZ 840]|uniref:M16 family metallopeptidase n=1 Tax=Treponema sp. OMZ 840 TaxID=244313 RepID=UPI003D8D12A9